LTAYGAADAKGEVSARGEDLTAYGAADAKGEVSVRETDLTAYGAADAKGEVSVKGRTAGDLAVYGSAAHKTHTAAVKAPI